MYIVSAMDHSVIALMAQPIKADLGIGDFQISLLHRLSFVFFSALFGLPMGWLVDRYSRRVIITVGMIVWSLATVSGGLARTFFQLALARFGVGIGESTLSPSAYSI